MPPAEPLPPSPAGGPGRPALLLVAGLAACEGVGERADGFAIDPGSGLTHNIFAVLPGEESYAPLWVLQIFKLVAFDRFNSLADAIREDPENAIDVGILHVNAPVVSLIADEGVDGE